jgi:peroxiredoxin
VLARYLLNPLARFKRYFPIPYLIVGSIVIGYGVWEQVQVGHLSLAWVGAIVAIAPLVVFMMSLVVIRRPRTWRNEYPLLIASAFGTGLAFLYFESPASWFALLFGFVPSFIYVYWYSVLDRSGSSIKVGAQLPELALVDAEGRAVVPTSGKLGLYMFIRGNWCPLCMAQVKEISAQYRELEARGVEVFLISPQSEKHTQALAKRFDVPIRFCVDVGNRAARKLGIEHVGGVPFMMEPLGYEPETVLPTVVIIDAKRSILFADLTDNYRVRPEPSTFLAVLDAHA